MCIVLATFLRGDIVGAMHYVEKRMAAKRAVKVHTFFFLNKYVPDSASQAYKQA